MAYKGRCRYGKLATPVRDADGSMRYCKMKKKTKKGRSQDRKKKSGEFHEVRHRKSMRKAHKGTKSKRR